MDSHRKVWMVGCFLGGWFFCLASFGFTQGEDGARRFMELQGEFEAAAKRLEQPVARLNASYVKALDKLLKEESGAGNLERSLQVKKELDGFAEGAAFDSKGFDQRASNNAALEALRRTYVGERERILKQGQGAWRDWVSQYQNSLKHFEEEQTKLQHFDLAQRAQKQRLALAKDPRFIANADASPNGKPVSGRLHFVVKGEIELRHNGDKLGFRNSSDNPQYVDGVTRPRDFQAGDIVTVKIRSTAVFRNLIMALESAEGKVSGAIGQIDYRYLGEGVDAGQLDPEKVNAIKNRPQNGEGDANMISLWKKHQLPEPALGGSEWIRIGASAEWHVYAIVITPKMLGEGG